MVSFSLSTSLAVLSLLVALVHSVGVDEWRRRSIYQVLTDRFAVSEDADPKPCDPAMGVHCGGSWKGIYEHLDYIEEMNFDAIWISPIQAQMPNWTADGEAYPGYWQQDMYDINLSYGSEEDLRQLIDEIHKRGMLLMLDIVVNHMVGPQYDNGEFDYSMMRPFNKKEYYHEYCPSGYSDEDITNLQDCWLGSENAPLADLDTESEEVRRMLGMWIKNQIWKWGVDGLRIDAAINVPSDFFPGFMKAADVFATSEVYTRQEKLACEYQGTIGSVLNYPLYWPLTEAFATSDGSMATLKGMLESIHAECTDMTVLGTFSENHDVPRFKNSTTDLARARNVATFVLTNDGIPVIYYGIEQHLDGDVEPYFNRGALWEAGFDQEASIYKLIATLNLLRRHVGRSYEQYLMNISAIINADDHTIAFAKGGPSDPKVITILNNNGEDSDDFSVELCKGHGYSNGDELTDVVSCKDVQVENDCITTWISDGEPVVLFKKSELEGSTLCGIEGASNVDLVSKAIISTTWTSVVEGTPTVFHSASTVPWSEAPASITAATSSASGSAAASTGGSDKVKRHEHRHHHHARHHL